jgi:multidrug resistance efflux pump
MTFVIRRPLNGFTFRNHDISHRSEGHLPIIFTRINQIVMKKVCLLFFPALFIAACSEQHEKIFPEKTMLTESVYSSATIQPDSLYQAYAAVAGILDRNLVEEGAQVKKGDAILQIINSAPKLNTDNARLALNLAKENYEGRAAILGEMEDEIEAAVLSLKNDSINYYRQKRLWDQKIGSKVEFDNRKLAYELSENRLGLLTSKYDRTKRELATQVEQAENNYKTSMISTKDFTVRSKINGKVYALYKNPGELVSTMEPLAAVGSADIFIIELLVDEVDIVKLRLGQKALVTLDAYSNQVFEAVVSKIYPRKDERSQTFTVEAKFKEVPEVLYPGLSGEGNIVIAEKNDVLTIPKDYLMEDNQVLTENGAVKVTLGLQNLDRVEILEGIDEKTALLKPKS